MERESFEDETVAALLNEHYVAIKVDREERPDIDHLYMSVCQAMTGEGGWPLTILMTPDRDAFFAGTYFPKERRYGRPGLVEILTQIQAKWTAEPERILASAQEITNHIQRRYAAQMPGEWQAGLVQTAVDHFTSSFDAVYGGFGQAPKFPSPHNLLLLLRYAAISKDESTLAMVEKTLDGMRRGGIFDQIGYGFSRYSTDATWLVPHFEKMLYDNALLMMAYTEAYQLTGKPVYARVTSEIAEFVLRDLTSEDGAFYSALDADSEGEEGRFYLWTPEQVSLVLGVEDGARYGQFFDVTSAGNFEGRSIPNFVQTDVVDFLQQQQTTETDWWQRVGRWNEALWAEREKRIHPYRDDKVLTAWNGLMIAAFAKAGRALNDERLIAAARRAAAFVLRHLVHEERLYARYRDGDRQHLGYLDDYAYWVWGLIELYESTLEPTYLEAAVTWHERMKALFADEDRGGFYFTGADAPELFARVKEWYDGAMPSGNAIAAMNLLRMSRLTGQTDDEAVLDALLRAAAPDAGYYPAGHTALLLTAWMLEEPGEELVVVCRDVAGAKPGLGLLRQVFLPHAVWVVKTDEIGQTLTALAPYTADMSRVDDLPTIYVCKNFACSTPSTAIEACIESVRSHYIMNE